MRGRWIFSGSCKRVLQPPPITFSENVHVDVGGLTHKGDRRDFRSIPPTISPSLSSDSFYDARCLMTRADIVLSLQHSLRRTLLGSLCMDHDVRENVKGSLLIMRSKTLDSLQKRCCAPTCCVV